MKRYAVAVVATLCALSVLSVLTGCGSTTAGTATGSCYADYIAPGCPSSPTGTGSGWASPSGGVGTDPASGLPWIAVSQLTPEGRTVLQEIEHGGPFAYPGKDGSVFGNFEGELPKEGRGYYHEYTVPTPGAHNRGTRRIITGSPGEAYWTADHYEHFARIKETIKR